MKKVLSIYLAIVLSVLALLAVMTIPRTHDQSSAISDACRMAAAKDLRGLRVAFEDIAAHDPGYMMASIGAVRWSNVIGMNLEDRAQAQFADSSGFQSEAMAHFLSLCDSYLWPKSPR